MLYGSLHPAIFNYLQTAGISLLPFSQSTTRNAGDVVIISAYHQTSKDFFSGIEELQTLRLAGNINPVIFLSFIPQRKIVSYDIYNVLSLPGISFVQLPATKNDLLKAIKNTESVPQKELEDFRVIAYKKLLSQNAKEIRHRFVNIMAQLEGDCVMAKSNSAFVPVIKQKLQELNGRSTDAEFKKFFELAKSAPQSNDVFFINSFKFVTILEQLANSANSETIEPVILIKYIDELNNVLLFISEQ